MGRDNNNKPWQDGKYLPEELFDAFTKKFESESDLKKFIVDNIVEFSKEVLGIEYDRHIIEYKITDGRRKSKSIDLFIYSKQNEVIAIELKNPTHKAELQNALGQCLVYRTVLELTNVKIDRFILVSSIYDILIPLTICKMGLNIEFVCINQSRYAVMQKL
jgi:hypothetical protein